VQIADLAGGGLWAAVRILAALREGQGTHLDVSMTEGAMSLLLPWLGDRTFGGQPLRRGERTLNGGYAGYGAYRAGDGKYLAVGALEPKFWGGLCREVGISGSAADPAAPAERQRELREQLGRALGGDPRDAWCERLERADVCVEPVLEMEELEGHPQHRARGLFYTLQDPQRGPLSLLRLPVDGEPAQRPAPRHGEHTDEVLAAEGVTAEEIAELRAQGAIK
jgi:crotonobetainyl-CoA:carnitine CoA-transferase CaiB-like acyl-CoA transferase